ncbi:MAG: aminodeoxychorismate/anthranilate synthase component II [Alphaproteobacteria bacterium]|nr:aminodeoxychorismate/anthranilate synthase component II [Alphaproteobacteria bacterium]
MILLIDNYDSFTYNLYHYLLSAGSNEVLVKRNDAITLDEISNLKPRAIVISPGPCTPNEAGICLDVINKFKGKIPLFGVCLGHQAIGQAFGGKIVRTHPMHGKISEIHHSQQNLFKNIPSPFKATRYHSLIIDKNSCPKNLTITAQTSDGIIMGIADESLKIYGVQFHPESIATEFGHEIFKNFINLI